MSGWKVGTPAEMSELGKELARAASTGDVFGLIGSLGSGKTHWSKGFVNAIDAGAHVTSPTFSIVNEYRGGKFPIFHFDFYRLKSADELIALGWDEYLDEAGIVICEWANMFPELMPENTTWLEILHSGEGTRMVRRIKDPAEAGPL
jgi:tRNA threonylcarbamoyladenosine biosynthesis protein TsaE